MRFAFIDSTIALSFALFINAAILIVAAATFHGSGNTQVAEIQDAYQLLTPLLGVGVASTVFALALLASGQNSTLTGTLAGQIVMEGFLNIRMRPWLRRLITRGIAIVPAVIVAVLYGESGTARLLVLQPGDPVAAALVRRLPAGDVHVRPDEDGSLRQPALAEVSGLRRRGHHRRAQCLAAGADRGTMDGLMYRRILVPLEHSATDACILEHVKLLARHCSACAGADSRGGRLGGAQHQAAASCASPRR